MKLSEIVAEIKGLKDAVAGFIGDKAKATAEALTGLKTKLEALEATVTGQLTQLANDLATANKDKEKLSGDLKTAQDAAADANKKLVAFLTGLKQTPAEGATLIQNVEAATKAVSVALAAQGIKADDLPATEPEQGGTGKKSLSEQVDAIKDPVEKSKFIQKNMAALEAEMRARMKSK